MRYILKEAEREIGRSDGMYKPSKEGTYWITGWIHATRGAVSVGRAYTLVSPEGGSKSVEVAEIGGQAMGGIRFKPVD